LTKNFRNKTESFVLFGIFETRFCGEEMFQRYNPSPVVDKLSNLQLHVDTRNFSNYSPTRCFPLQCYNIKHTGYKHGTEKSPTKFCFCILCSSWKLIIYIKGTSCALYGSNRVVEAQEVCLLIEKGFMNNSDKLQINLTLRHFDPFLNFHFFFVVI
jgi:hypothetical protein